jgi:succinate-acetate transporter protein
MDSLIPNLIRTGVAIICFLMCLVIFNMLGWVGLISAIFAFYVATSMQIETEEELDIEEILQASHMSVKE